MKLTAQNMIILSEVIPDRKKAIELSQEICEGILRDFLNDYHFGSHIRISKPLRAAINRKESEQLTHDEFSLLNCLSILYDIIKLHFDIFESLESDKYINEDWNFTSYILRCDDFINDLKDYAKENKLVGKLKKTISDLQEAYKEFNPQIQYPTENQSVEDYLESVE